MASAPAAPRPTESARAQIMSGAGLLPSAAPGAKGPTAARRMWWSPLPSGVSACDPLAWLPRLLKGGPADQGTARDELMRACAILRELDAKQGWSYVSPAAAREA